MAINLKNREAELLLRALSRGMSQGKTKIVLDLLRAESVRQARLADVDGRKKKIKALARRTARKARNRERTPEELIGYDKHGLPR